MKRKRGQDAAATGTAQNYQVSTPTKRPSRVLSSSVHDESIIGSPTPIKSKSALRQAPTPSKTSTPRKQARFAASSPRTPTTQQRNYAPASTPHQADRSARRKSARLLIRQADQGEGSDAEDSQDELLAQHIYAEDEEDGESSSGTEGDANAAIEEEEPGADADHIGQDQDQDGLLPETPTKRPRGRPKGPRKQRTPTPPPDLPPHEHYFFAHRPGGSKTSDNTLPPSALASHEEYYEALRSTETPYKDPHESSLDFLHALHSRSFDQWLFELEQAYSVCLYGYGSKRELMLDFAAHVASSAGEEDTERPIVVVNGFNTSLGPRDILSSVATIIPLLSSDQTKVSAHPQTLLAQILAALVRHPLSHPITLLIHNIDGPSLRRPGIQSLLARLASASHIRLIASADAPNFALLWDVSLRQQFNWVFHDATTFQPLDIEIEGSGRGVVDSVNALLGRSGRKIQGREGVMYVLKSLTQSARSLYALLLGELLSAAEEGGSPDPEDLGDDTRGGYEDNLGEDAVDGDSEEEEEAFTTPLRRKRPPRTKKPAGGIMPATTPLRTLYTLSTQQFIATNEMSFRGLLKEFTDHEMVVLRRDVLGTEVLGVPFRKGEVESLVMELATEG